MSKNRKMAEPSSQIGTQRLGCPSGDGVRLKRRLFGGPAFPPPDRLFAALFPHLGFHFWLGFQVWVSSRRFSSGHRAPPSFRPAPWPKFDRAGLCSGFSLRVLV